MKFRKGIAVLLTAALITGGTGTVLAAESYSDAEKISSAAAMKEFTALYDAEMDEAEKMMQGAIAADADLSLEIDAATRALLGMAASYDLSWLSKVGISYNTTIAYPVEAVTGSIYVNETDVCNFEVYLNMENMMSYLYVPEILPYYLKVDMSGAYDAEMNTSVKELMKDPMVLYPEGAVLEELLNRYLAIVFDHFEGSAGSTTTINLNGMEQEVAAYEGKMYEKNAFECVTEFLTAAREDEQIKTLIETWTQALAPEYSGQSYGEYQSAVDELLSEMDESVLADTDNSEYIFSRIWTDEEDCVIGREIGWSESGSESPVFSYLSLDNETGSELVLQVNADGTTVGLEGSGTITDGMLEGIYSVVVDGRTAAEIAVTGYQPEALAEGALNGTYKLSLEPGFVEDEEYNMLTSFDLILDCAVDAETEDTALTLSVLASDAPLGSLKLTAGYGEAAVLPDFSSLENVLDTAVEEDGEIFMNSLDWTPLKENCLSAGIPAELVEMADEAIHAEIYGEY